MKQSWLKKACQMWQICYKGKTYCSQIFKDVKIGLVWNILKPSKSFTKPETGELGCGVAHGCNVRQKFGKTLNNNFLFSLLLSSLFIYLFLINPNFHSVPLTCMVYPIGSRKPIVYKPPASI